MANNQAENRKGMHRNLVIDRIKGICIVLIVITHYAFNEADRMNAAFPLLVDMAVPMLIIVMGFNYAQAYKRNNIETLEEAYSPNLILRRLARILLPFIWFVIIEIVLQLIVYKQYDFRTLVQWIFPVGGFGAGSYFIPVTLQIIFVYPLIYFLVKGKGMTGLLVTLLINICYEWCCVTYGMNENCYRLLCFRYLFCIGIGTYLAMKTEQDRTKNVRIQQKWGGVLTRVIMMLIGAFVLLGMSRRVIIFTYVNKTWKSTSYLSGIYLFPIASVLLGLKLKPKKVWTFIEIIGRASFNVFLVQMTYYVHFCVQVYQIKAVIESTSTFQNLMLSLAICITAGVLFYEVEHRLSDIIFKRIHISSRKIDQLTEFINSFGEFI